MAWLVKLSKQNKKPSPLKQQRNAESRKSVSLMPKRRPLPLPKNKKPSTLKQQRNAESRKSVSV
jgi:hypothetical protein